MNIQYGFAGSVLACQVKLVEGQFSTFENVRTGDTFTYDAASFPPRNGMLLTEEGRTLPLGKLVATTATNNASEKRFWFTTDPERSMIVDTRTEINDGKILVTVWLLEQLATIRSVAMAKCLEN